MSQNFVPETLRLNQKLNSPSGNKNVRPKYIIPPKDTATSYYAKLLGMSNEEFKLWTSLDSNTIKKGTKVPLPMDKVPEGKGIYALAKKYNMSMDEFCKLNKIPKPYNEYKAKKNEEFYVKPYKVENNKAQKTQQNKEVQKPVEDSEAKPANEKSGSFFSNLFSDDEANVSSGVSIGATAMNKAQWGSSFSPQEIADKLEQEANNTWGAVGKKPFDDMLKEINPQNVSEVLNAYSKANDGRSLINRITSEITSRQDLRKNAVMHIYDVLAEAKDIPAVERNKFVAELNKQFDSFGMVDTTNLDATIDKMLAKKMPQAQMLRNLYTVKSASPDTKINLSEKKGVFTAKQLREDAIESAKKRVLEKFQKYCADNNIPYDKDNLDLSPIKRIPGPIVKNGKVITSETVLLKPTTVPNGKVVILNAGHGGYSARSGCYDTGSYSFIKKGSGKYAPLIESEKMNIYSEYLTDKLRERGYSVVITSGHVETISDDESISNLITNLETGKKSNRKYGKDDIMMISLHADSSPGQSGTGVCYDSRFKDDRKLASILENNLNKDDWITAGKSERNWDVEDQGLQVLHQSENIPSALVEVEYVNGSKSKNLDSLNFQTRLINKLVDGLDEYFGIK